MIYNSLNKFRSLRRIQIACICLYPFLFDAKEAQSYLCMANMIYRVISYCSNRISAYLHGISHQKF